MDASPHFRDLLRAFYEAGVEYLVVGGYAVMRYAEPRFTKDLDLWVNPSAGNSQRVFDALARFGAPLAIDGVTPTTFGEVDVVYQIGVAPVRCDIANRIDGVEFDQAWINRVQGSMFGIPVFFISLPDLIANKRATGRPRDLEDCGILEAIAGTPDNEGQS